MRDLIIIGGGSSIREFPTLWDDLLKLKSPTCGYDVMSVNYAYRFLKSAPRWQVSIDRKFWKLNAEEMKRLNEAGTVMLNQDCGPVLKTYFEEAFFCGARKLSGVFALSYATRELRPERIFLFGFDFGTTNGKTHFYDEPRHSGMGKSMAYLDSVGAVLPAVADFDHFKKHQIFIVGKSNIKSFPKVDYAGWKAALECSYRIS